jgi:hypothetical protein
VFNHADAGTFDKIVREQEKDPERRLLVLLDDVAGEHAVNTGRKGGLPKLANNARWLNITLVAVVQNLTSVTPALRDNAEGIMFFQTLNVKETALMTEERNPFPTRQQMAETIWKATREPHGFLSQLVTNDGVRHFTNFGPLASASGQIDYPDRK